jgi:hypothetical protein
MNDPLLRPFSLRREPFALAGKPSLARSAALPRNNPRTDVNTSVAYVNARPGNEICDLLFRTFAEAARQLALTQLKASQEPKHGTIH